MAVLITAAIVLSMTVAPSAAQFRLGDVEPIVFAGRVQGNGNNRDVDIGEVRLGFGNYFRERLGLYSELSLYRPTGLRDRVSVDTYGLGLSFAVRWHFLQASGSYESAVRVLLVDLLIHDEIWFEIEAALASLSRRWTRL